MNKNKALIIIISILIVIGVGIGLLIYFDPHRRGLELEKRMKEQATLITGLPKEIEENEKARIHLYDESGYTLLDKRLLPFEVSFSEPLDLEAKRIDTGKDRHFYWDPLESPIFGADRQEEIRSVWREEYIAAYSSLDKRYFLEWMPSDPDNLAHLWDFKEKKVYQVLACGTVCHFKDDGFVWLDNERFLIIGEEANPQRNYDWSKGKIKFTMLFDLGNLSVTKYSSKRPEPQILEYLFNLLKDVVE